MQVGIAGAGKETGAGARANQVDVKEGGKGHLLSQITH